MKRWVRIALGAGIFLALLMTLQRYWDSWDVQFWQQQVNPGLLSSAHANLESECSACHTPAKGAEATKCIGCHANNTALLQRQPTAFHASVGECRSCHIEHQGASVRPIAMDHIALAHIGLAGVRANAENPSNSRLLTWIRQHERGTETVSTHPRVTSAEAALDCLTCHGTKDRHQGYFGGDCASCHATASWSIQEFQHPLPSDVECEQCHRPPPSHYMEHFTMISQSVAKQPRARVDQCFLCHQTTSWNDIRRVGWHKHH